MARLDLNTIIVSGRLTKDVEFKSTGDFSVASFTVANNRGKKKNSDEEITFFLPVKVFNKQAELVQKYLKKGDYVMVEGILSQRSYTIQDGTKRFAIEIIANRVLFGPSASSNQQPTQQQKQPVQQKQPIQQHETYDEYVGFDDDIDMNEIPF